MAVPEWFLDRLGWKRATRKAEPRCMRYFGVPYGPNLADLSGTSSTRIAGAAYRIMGIPTDRVTDLDIGALESAGAREAGAGVADGAVVAAGTQLETDLERDLLDQLREHDPGRNWLVTRHGQVSQFAQYEHLAHLQQLLDEDPTLRTTIGRDYQVTTDVLVGVPSHWEGGAAHALHAAVSSKLTIRSDRVQNVRVEFGTLVRNRRGRAPHLVVVTAEPMPSRIVSVARGTGEIDAVYHLLFDELDQALHELRHEDRHLEGQWRDWREMVDMRRLRPYEELSLVLAGG